MSEPSPAEQVLAAIAADGTDPRPMPLRICQTCVQSLPVDGAALSLLTAGTRRELVEGSDDVTRGIEELELTLGEGPGLSAYTSGGPVLIADLRSSVANRWPAFAEAATAAGIQASFAFPLQLGAVRLGVLTLYRRTAGPLRAETLADALRIADIVALLLVGQGGGLTRDFDQRWLDRSSWTREIDQATGMLTVQLGINAEDAFVRLRAYSFLHGRPLSEVARSVVTRQLRLAEESP